MSGRTRASDDNSRAALLAKTISRARICFRERDSASLASNPSLVSCSSFGAPRAPRDRLGMLVHADKEVVLAAVSQNGHALKHASEALRRDKEVVEQDGRALEYASEALRGDKEVVLAAVKQDGLQLRHASALKNDKEVVLEAVKQDGRALLYASKALCGDKEVVLAAVAQNGFALRFASETLSYDFEMRLVHARHGRVETAVKIVKELHELTKHLELTIGRAVELLKYHNDPTLQDAVQRLSEEFYAPESGVGYKSSKRDFEKAFGVDSKNS
jgi:hypothetical protein